MAASRRRPWRRREVVLGGLLAVTLAGAAVPRLMAALAASPGDAAAARLTSGASVAPADLAAVAETRMAALRWSSAAQYLVEGGLAASALPAPPGGSDNAAAARRWLEQGLARAPADPLGWAALAALDRRLGAAQAPRALGLALMTGPQEPAGFWQRLSLILDPRLREAAALDDMTMRAQLRLAWRRDPARTTELARQYNALPALRVAVAAEPGAAPLGK